MVCCTEELGHIRMEVLRTTDFGIQETQSKDCHFSQTPTRDRCDMP